MFKEGVGKATERTTASHSPTKHGRQVPKFAIKTVGEGEEITLEELFVLKCSLCKAIFSMNDTDGLFEAKEAKRNTLLELIELMDQDSTNDTALQHARATIMKSNKAMTELFAMIRTNLIRTPK